MPRRPSARSFPAACRYLALVVGVLAVVAAGCGSSGDADSSPRTTSSIADVELDADTPAPPAYRTFIANVAPDRGSITAFDRPGGEPLQLEVSGDGTVVPVAIPNPLPSGAPTTFRIKTADVSVEETGSVWQEVYLPVRPIGVTGWISATEVTVSHTDLAIEVSLSQHSLRLDSEGVEVMTVPVALGTPAAPTPTGEFYVKELVELSSPDGAYGPIAFGLSAFSPTLVDTEAFADGVIGIHGTNRPELIGSDASSGCIRLRNEDILALQDAGIPLGTPVTISA